MTVDNGQLTVMGIGDLLIPIIFFATLIWASIQDIRTKEVSDYIHVVIAVTAFNGYVNWDLLPMLLGAVLTALPLFIAALIKKDCIGGADIKLMTASGLILGAERGVIALIIGLFLGVVCTYVYRKVKKSDQTDSFAFVPYLAVGCMTAYLL